MEILIFASIPFENYSAVRELSLKRARWGEAKTLAHKSALNTIELYAFERRVIAGFN
jgi:hypothetical protein